MQVANTLSFHFLPRLSLTIIYLCQLHLLTYWRWVKCVSPQSALIALSLYRTSFFSSVQLPHRIGNSTWQFGLTLLGKPLVGLTLVTLDSRNVRLSSDSAGARRRRVGGAAAAAARAVLSCGTLHERRWVLSPCSGSTMYTTQICS